MGKVKRKKREAKILRLKLEKLAKETVDSAELFFKSIELKEKHDPHSRDKIRIDPCAYCGSSDHVLRTVDHIEPKASGGFNSLGNLASCCSGCNNEKGSMSLLEFLLHRQLAAEIR